MSREVSREIRRPFNRTNYRGWREVTPGADIWVPEETRASRQCSMLLNVPTRSYYPPPTRCRGIRNLILNQLHIRNLVSPGYTACEGEAKVTRREELDTRGAPRRVILCSRPTDIQTYTIMILDYNYKMRYCSSVPLELISRYQRTKVDKLRSTILTVFQINSTHLLLFITKIMTKVTFFPSIFIGFFVWDEKTIFLQANKK